MKKYLIVLGIVIVLGGIGFFLRNRNINLLSPLGRNMEVKKERELKVIGFLPTWMVGKTRVYSKEIDELIFLGIEVDEDGALVWDTQGKKINSEDYLKQKAEISKNKGKNVVGIKLFKDSLLDEVLADEKKRKNLVAEIKTLVTAGRFDGVNIDFEWMADPLKVTGVAMEVFLKALREAEVGTISVDVFANTVIKGGKESLLRLTGAVDEVIVMAYDFSQAGSDYANSVAPIKAPEGRRSISEVTERIVALGLEAKKFILAYPLYGYEWSTEGVELGSATLPGVGQMASFTRVNKLIEEGERDLKVEWEETAMTPWLSFTQAESVSRTVWTGTGKNRKKKTVTEQVDRIHQIHYDDLRSLKIKVDLAKQAQVAGVGFWALGYEGEDKEVWKLMNN